MINTINVANAIANISASYVLIKPPPFIQRGANRSPVQPAREYYTIFCKSVYAGVFYSERILTGHHGGGSINAFFASKEQP
jgi:hypothetical protein